MTMNGSPAGLYSPPSSTWWKIPVRGQICRPLCFWGYPTYLLTTILQVRSNCFCRALLAVTGIVEGRFIVIHRNGLSDDERRPRYLLRRSPGSILRRSVPVIYETVATLH